MIFYVSSYAKGNDKGIYIINLDESTNELSLVNHLDTQDFPSYMITKDNHLCVSYKNASRFNSGGGVGIFKIQDDTLSLVSQYESQGRSYTHLCLSPDNKYLFTANYHVGSTASYLLDDFKVVSKIGAIHHRGLGPDLLKRQTGPHAHCVGITPDNKYVYSVDLGADKIVMYEYNDGKLTERTDLSQSVIPGSGPRHMVFSKDGRFSYVVNEISNCVMVYSYLEGHYTLLQVIHCVPRHFHGFSSASGIRINKSGKHLFVSNRGHDSIVLYRINPETGKLSLLYMVHTGKEPRDFNIINEKYLVVASQEDNRLELLTFNEEKEELVKTDITLDIPAPVCVAVND